jgi:hypothetical protein
VLQRQARRLVEAARVREQREDVVELRRGGQRRGAEEPRHVDLGRVVRRALDAALEQGEGRVRRRRADDAPHDGAELVDLDAVALGVLPKGRAQRPELGRAQPDEGQRRLLEGHALGRVDALGRAGAHGAPGVRAARR